MIDASEFDDAVTVLCAELDEVIADRDRLARELAAAKAREAELMAALRKAKHQVCGIHRATEIAAMIDGALAQAASASEQQTKPLAEKVGDSQDFDRGFVAGVKHTLDEMERQK
jgi:hypothetical protein